MAFTEWLKIFHIGLLTLPWLIGIMCRRAWILLLCLAINFVVLTQWLILGRCILNEVENNGASKESSMMIDVAEYFNIPLQEFKDGYVLINSLAPSFLQMSRIAGALGL